jgi:hypothetical protein
MGFLSPWFLGGLLAAGLPLYVHLLRQHKTVPMPFSSLMFFERRTQSSVKHRRLKYLALLALRLAIVLLLALLFANPFIKVPAATADAGKKHIVVAVDNSFSMRAGDRLARAKQEAMNVLGTLRAGDRAQVIAFGSNAQLMTQPTDDQAELRAAVQAIQPGDSRSSYGEIARSLRSIAVAGGPPVEAHVITDIQRSSLPSPFSELSLNSNTRLVLHPVASSREPNYFVESVSAPASVYQAKKVRVQTTIGAAGASAGEVAVSLLLNGKTLETRKVNLPATGRAALEFYLPDAAYGLNRGEVRIEPRDKLPQDDTFLFSIERKEPSRVLFVHEARNSRGLQFYRTAMESTPDSGFAVDGVTSDQVANVSPDKYASVVLSDVAALPSSFDQALSEYVKHGGSVFIAVGAASATRGRIPVFDEPILEARYASREGDRFMVAASADETHPSTSRVHKFEGVKFYQVARTEPKNARILARLADGTVLAAEKKVGAGKALMFASTLDNVANDFPLHPIFVPFIEQTAVYLSGIEPAPATYVVDSFLELRSGRDAGSAVEVIGPGGDRALSLKEAANAQAYRLTREGFYEVRRGNSRNELIAVHADRRESDLDVIPNETLGLWQSSGTGATGGSGAGGTGDKPYSLWWYFALALLVASIAESLFASRYLAVQEEKPVIRKQAA